MRPGLAALALTAAFLAGCGEEEKGARTTATVAAGQPVSVVGSEYAFDPANVVLEGAGRVKFSLRNAGVLAHNLKVFDGERELGGTPSFPGGRTESGEVDLEPGRYRLVCTVGNHEELGMVGTLEVR
jgi:plastocyanin